MKKIIMISVLCTLGMASPSASSVGNLGDRDKELISDEQAFLSQAAYELMKKADYFPQGPLPGALKIYNKRLARWAEQGHPYGSSDDALENNIGIETREDVDKRCM